MLAVHHLLIAQCALFKKPLVFILIAKGVITFFLA